MLRHLLAAALATAVAYADDPPKKPADPPKPAEPVKAPPTATVTLKVLTVKDGKMTDTVTVPEQYTYQEAVTTLVNGQPLTSVVQKQAVRMVAKVTMTKLADLKATGTDGKAIPGDELEKAYKDGGVVVVYTGKLDDKFRKLFKDGTVFVEDTPPAPPAPPPPGGLPK